MFCEIHFVSGIVSYKILFIEYENLGPLKRLGVQILQKISGLNARKNIFNRRSVYCLIFKPIID